MAQGLSPAIQGKSREMIINIPRNGSILKIYINVTMIRTVSLFEILFR